MPLSANTATVQILDDAASHLAVKFAFFQNSANATSHEASVLKVNVETLIGRTMILKSQASFGPNGLIPGEKLTANGGSGAIGYVTMYLGSDANGVISTQVVLANSQVQFANSDALLSDRSGQSFTLLATGKTFGNGALSTTAVLSLSDLWWSITGNTSTRIALEWSGSPNVEIVGMGAGTGYLGRNSLGMRQLDTVPSDGGNILISTYATPVYASYTIIAEFQKDSGFAQRPEY
jgi:hypothetical protein